MHKLAGLAAALLLLLLTPGLALAGAAGNALGVNPSAAATTPGGATRTLVVGADVFIGDRVETGPQGQVQILFADRTRLVVGPSSSLMIEDYLLRNDGSAGKLAIDMLAGAFRFATGDAAKNRYSIATPTGTIGVRGTEFDVYVAPEGDTRVLLYRGALRLCTAANACKDIASYCDLGQIGLTDVQLLGDARQTRGTARTQFKGEFVYAMNQGPLQRRFWFPTARDCLNATPTVPVQPPEDKPTSRDNRPSYPPDHVP